MRVFFSSLRCFFFAIRLRRFLITDPTVHLSGIEGADGPPARAERHAAPKARPAQPTASWPVPLPATNHTWIYGAAHSEHRWSLGHERQQKLVRSCHACYRAGKKSLFLTTLCIFTCTLCNNGRTLDVSTPDTVWSHIYASAGRVMSHRQNGTLPASPTPSRHRKARRGAVIASIAALVITIPVSGVNASPASAETVSASTSAGQALFGSAALTSTTYESRLKSG